MLSIVSFMQRFQPPPGLPCQAGDGHAVEDEDAESQRSTLALLKIHHPTGFSKIWVAISGPQNGGTVPHRLEFTISTCHFLTFYPHTTIL